MEEEPMVICRNHAIPLIYRGYSCPWCDFMNDVAKRLEDEYKRGFSDGVNAVEKESKKEPL